MAALCAEFYLKLAFITVFCQALIARGHQYLQKDLATLNGQIGVVSLWPRTLAFGTKKWWTGKNIYEWQPPWHCLANSLHSKGAQSLWIWETGLWAPVSCQLQIEVLTVTVSSFGNNSVPKLVGETLYPLFFSLKQFCYCLVRISQGKVTPPWDYVVKFLLLSLCQGSYRSY